MAPAAARGARNWRVDREFYSFLSYMFRLSCLDYHAYMFFYYDLGSYMIYNFTVIFVLSYLGIYEHVDHPFCIHVNIHDAML
jgi:hypothetical protein